MSQKTFYVGAIALVCGLVFVGTVNAQTETGTYTASPFDGKIQVQQQKLVERPTTTAALIDSDGDGVTNYDETNLYGTDPYKASTFSADMTDSQLLLEGVDPTTGKKMNFEDPRSAGQTVKNLFSVTSVEVASSTAGEEEPSREQLVFKGTAPAESDITIYIFSTPIVVTVKTDETGNWQYTLDQELSDGQHEVYVASVNNTGKIVAKSDAVPFVKEAGAVALGLGAASTSTTGTSSGWMILLGGIILLVIIIAAIVIAGLRGKKTEAEAPETVSQDPMPDNLQQQSVPETETQSSTPEKEQSQQ